MKILKNAGLMIGLGFTVFIIFAVVHNRSNKRFTVEFTGASQYENFENTPAIARIQASPAIVNSHVGTGQKIGGWICLVAMWVGIWLVYTDRLQGKKKVTDPGGRSPALSILTIMVPLILCAVFFFAGYASKFTANYVTVTHDRFKDWLDSGVIEKKGEKTYIDKQDSIKTLFDNKPFIN